jgi:hypothetical protein
VEAAAAAAAVAAAARAAAAAAVGGRSHLIAVTGAGGVGAGGRATLFVRVW